MKLICMINMYQISIISYLLFKLTVIEINRKSGMNNISN